MIMYTVLNKVVSPYVIPLTVMIMCSVLSDVCLFAGREAKSRGEEEEAEEKEEEREAGEELSLIHI